MSRTPSNNTMPRETALLAANARAHLGIVEADVAPPGTPVPAPLPALPGMEPPDPATQKQLLSQIVASMREMGRAEFAGTGGSLEGAIVRMPIRRLWINPWYPIRYDDPAKLRALGQSMRRRQEAPLIICPALGPDGVAGRTRDHVIVDGVQRFLAAPYGNLNELEVRVSVYPTIYHLMMATVAGKVSQHPLSDLDFARLLMTLRQSHELARSQDPHLPPFPTQEELGGHLGVSQETISRRLALARLDPDVLQHLSAGGITAAQARELVSAPPDVQRGVAAALVPMNAQRAAAGEGPVPSKVVREYAGASSAPQPAAAGAGSPAGGSIRLVAPRQWVTTDAVPAPATDSLWLPDLAGYGPPVAIGTLMHDLAVFLDHALASWKYPDPDVIALRKLLGRPIFRQLVEKIDQA
jgi:ParB-like chromosome segregation protein Spo0J